MAVNLPIPTVNNGLVQSKPVLLVVGHSWIRRLRENWHNLPHPTILSKFTLVFVHTSTIKNCLEAQVLLGFQHIKPSLILFLFGANDLARFPRCDVANWYLELLKITYFLFPRVKIIVSTVENRFPPHSQEKPGAQLLEFQRESRSFNSWLARGSQRRFDALFLLRGQHLLTDRSLYVKDGVHLTWEGEAKLLVMLARFLAKTRRCGDVPIGLTHLMTFCGHPERCRNCWDFTPRWKKQKH